MKPEFDANGVQIYLGDCREVLRQLPSESVHTCVTSPPYWGLRDYGTASWEGGELGCDHIMGMDSPRSGRPLGNFHGGDDQFHTTPFRAACGKCGATRIDRQIGLEDSPVKYIATMREVFSEVRRVLRPDGTLWLNMGDSYATGAGSGRSMGGDCFGKQNKVIDEESYPQCQPNRMPQPGLKPKDLVGIPWMLAFALREDGWYLRQDIIWAKPNPMPESVTDRCTKSHEYIFLLSKSERYYYNADAIKEDSVTNDIRRPYTSEGAWQLDGRPAEQRHGVETRKTKVPGGWDMGDGAHGTIHRNGRTSAEYIDCDIGEKRNKRSVWEISTAPFPEAHFATFPIELIKPCILAGCPEGGTVLDPFMGSGTTGLVARSLHSKAIGIELNPVYIEIAAKRLQQEVLEFVP